MGLSHSFFSETHLGQQFHPEMKTKSKSRSQPGGLSTANENRNAHQCGREQAAPVLYHCINHGGSDTDASKCPNHAVASAVIVCFFRQFFPLKNQGARDDIRKSIPGREYCNCVKSQRLCFTLLLGSQLQK